MNIASEASFTSGHRLRARALPLVRTGRFPFSAARLGALPLVLVPKELEPDCRPEFRLHTVMCKGPYVADIHAVVRDTTRILAQTHTNGVPIVDADSRSRRQRHLR